ncbi:hypothetical protein M011DRAFT_399878 [Sporormia fimetaria CBS 119925]|uniref:Uncharacterized protein n=1 Tax=Sporormia fimetaria CBS 119925 TaxID=1340428 RepID=A0A6A6VFY6_9PLEO|nr:hypothetical protein M011DRAFT_399878 [Sporormia fimetaria CBS 119925]
MMETLKDLKHAGKNSYENLRLERTASQILHHMEDKDSEDTLESTRARVLANARAIYGATRHLDIISYAPTSSRKIGAAIVEHQPTGRSYIHCASAKEGSRLAAVEHLLVITEDILQRLLDAEGITSSGWLPATPQSQHAALYNASVAGSSIAGSVAPSGSGSPSGYRASVAPSEYSHFATPLPHHHEPHHHEGPPPLPAQDAGLPRTRSDHMYSTPPASAMIPRAKSELIAQPLPIPAASSQMVKPGRMKWHLGSEGEQNHF